MKKNECTFICDQYTDYKDQSLSNELKVQVETHLTSCKSCQKVFRELDQVLTSLHSLEAIQTGPDFNSTLQSRISSEAAANSWQRIYSSTYTKVAGYAIAAGLVVAIGLNFLLDPVSLQTPGAVNNFAIEEQGSQPAENTAATTSDTMHRDGSDSLQLNRKTIDAGSSSLQLVSGNK